MRIVEYIGLKAKVYSIIKYVPDHPTPSLDIPGFRKLKGVGRAAVKANCRHLEYRKYLHSTETQFTTFNRLMSTRQQQIYTVRDTKKALSAFDSKRRFCSDGIRTRAHGNWRDRVSTFGDNSL